MSTSKVKRTHIYKGLPENYDIECPKNPDHKITWSEFERHIWCYDCEQDINQEKHIEASGVFSGPIPVQISNLLGMSFDRVSLKTGEVIEFMPTLEDPIEKVLWQSTFRLGRVA